MSTDENQAEVVAPELSPPSEDLAVRVMRELEWDERIEGSIFDPGPGLVLQRIYRLAHLSNFLDAAANFTVDMSRLQTWLRDVIGDPALADAAHEVIEDAQSRSEADMERREAVASLLRLRVQQCEEVLSSRVADDEAGV